MMKFLVILLFILLNSFIVVTEFPIHIPFYRLFDNGIAAYGNENWLEAINYLEWALLQKEFHINSTITCLGECRAANARCSVDLCHMPDYQNIYFLVKKFHCMKRCKGKKLRSIDYMKGKDYNYPPDDENLLPFVSGSLYDYLQFSYYKAGNIENSTQALRTWLAYNPNNPRAKAGLHYLVSVYTEGQEASEPRKSPFFLYLFNRGWDIYLKENWADSVNVWEYSLKHLLGEIGRCRNTCQDSVASISSGLLFSRQYSTLQLSAQLRCHSNCYFNITKVGGYDNLLFSLFLYLQYSYYKIRKPLEAISAAKTAKLINPINEEIDGYLSLYLDMVDAESTSVVVRPEVRTLLEELEQINSLALASDDILPLSIPDKPEMSELELTQDSQSFIAGSRSTRPKIVLPPTDFSAARVLVDNFFSEAECRQLVLLADQASVEGDGYSNMRFGTGSSPHTPHENFTGVTLDGALQAWKAGVIPKKLVLLYLEMAERSRAYLESYFRLNTTLYFSYTHLVCRTAKENSEQENRHDLSHPVHADNCILEEDGTCLKVAPAYTWRDYSSLVYLNQDFEGGDFFFANRSTLQPEVRVATNHFGRMVGFSAGEENLHGVLPLTQGKRCALALWFTLERAHSEDRETFRRKLL